MIAAQNRCGEGFYGFVTLGMGATIAILLGVIVCLAIELDWRTKNMQKTCKDVYTSNDKSKD